MSGNKAKYEYKGLVRIQDTSQPYQTEIKFFFQQVGRPLGLGVYVDMEDAFNAVAHRVHMTVPEQGSNLDILRSMGIPLGALAKAINGREPRARYM